MKGYICTINTDAGFYPREKIGSFAYWIKTGNLFLHGGGPLKGKCTDPLDAEMKSIINAVHILDASKFNAISKIIFNRDNINAKSGEQTELQKLLKSKLREIRTRCIENLGKANVSEPYWEFRHVKSHSGTGTKRQFVNDWCDQRCKDELRKLKYSLEKIEQ